MANPARTAGSAGNVSSATSLAASGTRTVTLDLASVLWGDITIGCVFGTVAATSGLQFVICQATGSTAEYDTVGNTAGTVPATASATEARTIRLMQGLYEITLTNLDATNAVTPHITSDTYSS